MKLTPARPSDIHGLADILANWRDEVPWMPKLHTLEEDRRFIGYLIDTKSVWVQRNWRGPQGFMALDGDDIQALYLSKASRGRRLGQQLLDKAKSMNIRLELWAFQQNERAISFYLREGLREVERTDGADNDEKLPDIRMVWEQTT